MDIRKTYARKDVDTNYAWDLSQIFKNDKELYSSLEEAEKSVDEFVENYKGKLNTSEIINDSLVDLRKLLEDIGQIGSYSFLIVAEDNTNFENSKKSMEIMNRLNKIQVKVSFFKNEVLANDENILQATIEINPENKTFIGELIEETPYLLSEEGEYILSQFSNTIDAFKNIYNAAKLQDMTFPKFEANGEIHDLSYNIYEGVTDNHPDKEIRRNSFRVFSDKLDDYKNVTAQAYLAHCQAEKTIASLKGFDSVIDYLLFEQRVDRELYNRQIDLIMEHLAPIMRKYAGLLKDVHKLDEIKYEDLKIELDPTFSKNISVEDAKDIILDGLSVLGEEYREMIEKAFDERWIDFVNNTGKSTGAFCSSPYGIHPYILISWTGKMTETMVLSHELGHAGHFYLNQKEQNILDTRPSMYFIEAPSTTNELIMANTLLNNAKDKKEKRYYLSQMIARTYYHNFVTHFLEAAYQREVYNLIDEGKSFSANDLSNIYLSVLKEFWGDSIIYTKGCELTWMRQQHYYKRLYPYTYSAGLTIGTEVSQKILSEGQVAVDRWIDTLKLGGTKDIIGLAENAGVDISTEKPLMNTINFIGTIVDELEELTKEING